MKYNFLFTKLGGNAYFVVIAISLMISTLCSSLLYLVLVRNLEYKEFDSYCRLVSLSKSGINIALSSDSPEAGDSLFFHLSDDFNDTVVVKKNIWGCFEICSVHSKYNRKSLDKYFLSGVENKLVKDYALYLADHNVPFRLGDAYVNGDCYLPKGKFEKVGFSSKGVIKGKLYNSSASVPKPDTSFLKYVGLSGSHLMVKEWMVDVDLPSFNSFSGPTQYIHITEYLNIKDSIKGNMVIFCDKEVKVAAGAHTDDIIIIAPVVTFEAGFEGSLQVFARDSIVVGENCKLLYPSILCNVKHQSSMFQPHIRIGKFSSLKGAIFTIDNSSDFQKPLIILEEGVYVEGFVSTGGFVRLRGMIAGNVSANKLIGRKADCINCLSEAQIDPYALSSHYVSPVIYGSGLRKKLIKWLD
ncbi:hypothetical protein RCC89_05125 [Cytophagaceae bacterium ABcell3]|nr:hypothetical protein RCC89_05125 [Cytophagaceae bacterium ABcell3]